MRKKLFPPFGLVSLMKNEVAAYLFKQNNDTNRNVQHLSFTKWCVLSII